jgi:multidrug efflux pump subunit AcrA (membrane-fusion protein)
MKKVLIRRISLLAAIVFIIFSYIIGSTLQSQKKAPKKSRKPMELPLVNVFAKAQQNEMIYIDLSGRLSARDKIDIYAEVTGQLMASGKQFREGVSFEKGDTLLHLNDEDSRMSIQATRSTFQSLLTSIQADLATDFSENFPIWQKYMNDFNVQNELLELPEITDQKEKNFLISNQVYSQFFSIKSQEAKLRKFTILSPFDGIVHSANAVAGGVIRSGQKVGTLIGTKHYELEVGVSISDRNKIKINDYVSLFSEDMQGQWIGKIDRIGKAINSVTQTFKVYVRTSGEDLVEGMYLNARFKGAFIPKSTKLSSHLLINNQFVYGVERDSILAKYVVQVLHENQDQVWLSGIPSEAVLLAQPPSGLKVGSLVRTIILKK